MLGGEGALLTPAGVHCYLLVESCCLFHMAVSCASLCGEPHSRSQFQKVALNNSPGAVSHGRTSSGEFCYSFPVVFQKFHTANLPATETGKLYLSCPAAGVTEPLPSCPRTAEDLSLASGPVKTGKDAVMRGTLLPASCVVRGG